MLRYYICLYLLLYMIQTMAQSTLIARNSFENSGDNWSIESFSTLPCTDDNDSWNYHSTLDSIRPSEGNQFWGIKDLNGNCGSSEFESIAFQAIDIRQYRQVKIKFDYLVSGYDNGDDMKYQLWFDEEIQEEVQFVDGRDNLSVSWTTLELPVPNTVRSVKIMISVKQNGSDLGALDNLVLIGDPIALCNELLISEYAEGDSSRLHRNNYIELYNSSDSVIDLSSYVLSKYTGKNQNPSSELVLSGELGSGETFLIEDVTENLGISSDLSTNSSVLDFNGDDKIVLAKNATALDVIGRIGDSVNFARDVTLRRKTYIQSPNSQFDPSEWDVYPIEEIGDLNLHTSICEGALPEIEITGNRYAIRDGSNSTSLLNQTYFGAFPQSFETKVQKEFFIHNLGNTALLIDAVILEGPNKDNFDSDFNGPVAISANDSLPLLINYYPIEKGFHEVNVKILNSDSSENPFDFLIIGESTGPTSSPLIISQYYEGISNNKWVEISNIGDTSSPENMYYLALFRNDDAYNPVDRKPSSKILVPSILPGASLKYCASLNITAPEYALDGNEIKTNVCSFSGDDIIVISTSGSENCWRDKVDIIGASKEWGKDLSMVRKHGCRASSSNTGFNPSDWDLHTLDEIDTALAGSNLRIGLHDPGTTSWRDGGWTNGIPDSGKAVFIESDYSSLIHGSLEVCSLKIDSNAKMIVEQGNSLIIEKDLTVDGLLEIENNASLVIRDDYGIIENNGELLVHKRSSYLEPYDYTFWSSPVEGNRLEEVFSDSPQNSYFTFSAESFEDLNGDGLDDDQDAWKNLVGVMQPGVGYTAMSPLKKPFKNYQAVVFNGKVNNGIIEVPIEINANTISTQPQWSLMGNPYPSSIEIEAFLSHRSNKEILGKTIYFWTHSTQASEDSITNSLKYSSDDYAMYTLGTGGIKASANGKIPVPFISSCQGFFIQALNTGRAVFKNEMRTTNGTDNFFKPIKVKGPVEEKKIWLNLSNNEGAFSQILIGFVDGATQGVDQAYDGLRMQSGNYVNFYSLSMDLQLAVQGLPPIQNFKKVQLGFENKIEEPTFLEIGIEKVTDGLLDYSIILIDQHLKLKKDLRKGSYIFKLSQAGKFDDRFQLLLEKVDRFEVGTPPKHPHSDDLLWRIYDNSLWLNTLSEKIIASVEIYDLNGRQLIRSKIGDIEARIPWYGFPRRAIYIIRVLMEDSSWIVKKILP